MINNLPPDPWPDATRLRLVTYAAYDLGHEDAIVIDVSDRAAWVRTSDPEGAVLDEAELMDLREACDRALVVLDQAKDEA